MSDDKLVVPSVRQYQANMINEYVEAHRQAKKFTALFSLYALLCRFHFTKRSTELISDYYSRVEFSRKY